MEKKHFVDPFSSDRLVCLYRIGTISEENSEKRSFEQAVADVPADGSPSRRTGQTFTCRVWIGDVLMELGKIGLLELKKSIGEFMGSSNRGCFCRGLKR
jgi:hypothetical protein